VKNENNSAFCLSTFNLFWSVNAKQLEQPALQAGPSRCESGHGRQFALKV